MEKRDFFQGDFVILLKFDLKVKGHMGHGQGSRGSMANKGTKQRQVGSQQRQVASFALCIASILKVISDFVGVFSKCCDTWPRRKEHSKETTF